MYDAELGFLYAQSKMPRKYLEYWLSVPEFRESLLSIKASGRRITDRDVYREGSRVFASKKDDEVFDALIAGDGLTKLRENTDGSRTNGLGFLFYSCDMSKTALSYLVFNDYFVEGIRELLDKDVSIGNRQVFQCALEAYNREEERKNAGIDGYFNFRAVRQGLQRLAEILTGSRENWNIPLSD